MTDDQTRLFHDALNTNLSGLEMRFALLVYGETILKESSPDWTENISHREIAGKLRCGVDGARRAIRKLARETDILYVAGEQGKKCQYKINPKYTESTLQIARPGSKRKIRFNKRKSKR